MHLSPANHQQHSHVGIISSSQISSLGSPTETMTETRAVPPAQVGRKRCVKNILLTNLYTLNGLSTSARAWLPTYLSNGQVTAG